MIPGPRDATSTPPVRLSLTGTQSLNTSGWISYDAVQTLDITLYAKRDASRGHVTLENWLPIFKQASALDHLDIHLAPFTNTSGLTAVPEAHPTRHAPSQASQVLFSEFLATHPRLRTLAIEW